MEICLWEAPRARVGQLASHMDTLASAYIQIPRVPWSHLLGVGVQRLHTVLTLWIHFLSFGLIGSKNLHEIPPSPNNYEPVFNFVYIFLNHTYSCFERIFLKGFFFFFSFERIMERKKSYM